MKRPCAIIAIFVICLSSCDRQAGSAVAPEIAGEINRIQVAEGLSHDELAAVLGRWIEFYEVTSELLESEDVLGREPLTRERFQKWILDSENAMRGIKREDEMLAIYSLGHLKMLNERKVEAVSHSLRSIVSKHYHGIKEDPGDTGETFLSKAEELAATDPQLQRLLHNPITEETQE